MADVFISYSRQDSDFARQLHAALTNLGRDVWMDWEDIPVSEAQNIVQSETKTKISANAKSFIAANFQIDQEVEQEIHQ
jgi:hypothetical protein